MTTVHFVVPDGIDDPARPSGGNVYDRHLADGLTALGWEVHEHAVTRFWPELPDDAVVLVDGLVAALVPHAVSHRLVVLAHMPPDDGRVLRNAAAVITTSEWTRRQLLGLDGVDADRVHVAEPGVDAAELATGTPTGGALLCVAAVTPLKGHDVLLDALNEIGDLSWQCECVGPLDRDPPFVETLRNRSQRVSFPGPRTGADLDRLYAAADLLVLPSRAEAYGMVVTEALARGLPVVATDVGGVSEALGRDGAGLLVPPEDPVALATALRSWLADSAIRARLRRAARERRESLPSWSTTVSVVAGVLR